MTDIATQCEELRGKLDKLSDGDKAFALSLLSKHDGKGLTARAAPWIGKLLARIDRPAPKTVKVKGTLKALYAFIEKARTHLRFPKVILTADLGGAIAEDVKVYMSGKKSKRPNMINIELLDRPSKTRFGRYYWAGRVDANGIWEPPRYMEDDTDLITSVGKLMQSLAKDPHKIAAAHGKLTGNCCFCNQSIGHGDEDSVTTKRSRAAGYGQTCAKNFGLEAEWKRASSAEPKRKVRAGAKAKA